MIVKNAINSLYTSLKGGVLFSISHWFIYWAHHLSRMQMKILYILTGNIYMLYLEIVTTTRCTLKCKHCIGDIPEIKADEQYTMSFEEYKNYLDNLLKNIKSLKLVRILGGEPLLNKDIDKIIAYTLEQTKIKQVYLVTNATVMLSDKVVAVLREYPKKLTVDISNYSANETLLSRLKIKEIVEICRKNNITVNCPESYLWNPISPVKYHDRSIKENKKYYRACASLCVGMHKTPDGEAAVFPCLRAGTLFLRGIGGQVEGKDYFKLGGNLQKKEILMFHQNDDFNACKYCNFLDDKRKQVIPAIQKENPPISGVPSNTAVINGA
ncbi:MAG: radical SAM protein [Spirochaetaceae bacterium]|nr:radical SAM protein [Spirochaetaceae bacterium]